MKNPALSLLHYGVAAMLLALLLLVVSCTAPSTKPESDRARNDTLYFPGQPFTDIYAAQLHNPNHEPLSDLVRPDGSLDFAVNEPLHLLSPAHRADVGVALAMSSDEYGQGRCFFPRHAVIWKAKEKAIAALILCFRCNTYRFEPESKLDLRNENMWRLRLVFEELGLLE